MGDWYLSGVSAARIVTGTRCFANSRNRARGAKGDNYDW